MNSGSVALELYVNVFDATPLPTIAGKTCHGIAATYAKKICQGLSILKGCGTIAQMSRKGLCVKSAADRSVPEFNVKRAKPAETPVATKAENVYKRSRA